MSIHKDFPRPWHITHTARHRAHGYYSHIRAANDNYVVERITDEDLALYIVQVVNERDQLRAELAAATARAEAAEAKLAAVPVQAMLECIRPDDYDFSASLAAVEAFAIWLEAQREQQSEVQP